MADLFAGTFNFTPAFTGQQIAIEAGRSAGQGFSSGMQAGSGRMNAQTQQAEQGLNQQKLDFQKNKYMDLESGAATVFDLAKKYGVF